MSDVEQQIYSRLNDGGGTAFPAEMSRGVLTYYSPGMTLRDWFAGQALLGIVGNVGFPVLHGISERVASDAYTLADAMLKAREGEQP